MSKKQGQLFFFLTLLLVVVAGSGATASGGLAAQATYLYMPVLSRSSVPGPGFWEQRPSTMPTPRSEMAAAVLDDKIWVPGGVGGARTFEAYEPATDSWSTKEPMPGDGRHHLMVTAFQDKIYVFGGSSPNIYGATASVWVYDPALDQWLGLNDMPEPRMAGAAVTLGGYIYIVGGRVDDFRDGRPLLRYNPADDSWVTLASMNVPREHVTAVALHGKIYAISGRWIEGGEFDSIEIYDPAADSWGYGPALTQKRGGHGSVVIDNIIYTVGGEVIYSGTQLLKSMELFDPVSQQWWPAPEMPYGLHGHPTVAYNGQIYVLGGSDYPGGAIHYGRVLVYTPGK